MVNFYPNISQEPGDDSHKNFIRAGFNTTQFFQHNIINSVQDSLKVQSSKLYNNEYMITSTQIRNAEIFAFIAVVVSKLLSRKVLFINRKTIETVKK